MLFNLASIALLAVGANAVAIEQPAQALAERQACVQSSYVVLPGDTLSGIASRLRSGVCAIAIANGIPNKNMIYPLQRLLVPLPGCTFEPEATVCCIPAAAATTHVALLGDTFQALGETYGLGWAAIQAANPGVSPTAIQIGATLRIPARRSNC